MDSVSRARELPDSVGCRGGAHWQLAERGSADGCLLLQTSQAAVTSTSCRHGILRNLGALLDAIAMCVYALAALLVRPHHPAETKLLTGEACTCRPRCSCLHTPSTSHSMYLHSLAFLANPRNGTASTITPLRQLMHLPLLV